MKPEREENMRRQIAEYTHEELITLAVQLQDTVDGHVQEKSNMQGAIEQMRRQNEAIRQELEAAPEPEDSAELITLRARNQELENLNAGLQRALAGMSDAS